MSQENLTQIGTTCLVTVSVPSAEITLRITVLVFPLATLLGAGAGTGTGTGAGATFTMGAMGGGTTGEAADAPPTLLLPLLLPFALLRTYIAPPMAARMRIPPPAATPAIMGVLSSVEEEEGEDAGEG